MIVDLNNPTIRLWIQASELEHVKQVMERSGFVIECMCEVSRGCNGELGSVHLIQEKRFAVKHGKKKR